MAIFDKREKIMRDALEIDNFRGFKYAPKTGLLYKNRIDKWHPPKVVTPLFSMLRDTAIKAKYRSKNYLVHRIAWHLMNRKKVPRNLQIDHKNGRPWDNRWENLKLGTSRDNSINMEVHRAGKLPGIYVRKSDGHISARIRIKGKSVHLGSFKTELEAHQSYMEAFEIEQRKEKSE